jgi:hypothetical protein
MRVGLSIEIREEGHRVALTPAGTKELTTRGNMVPVQRGTGEGSPRRSPRRPAIPIYLSSTSCPSSTCSKARPLW